MVKGNELFWSVVPEDVKQNINKYFKNNDKFVNFATPPCSGDMTLQALPYNARIHLMRKYSNNKDLSYSLVKEQKKNFQRLEILFVMSMQNASRNWIG